ncbi:MAG: rod shape-determining protein MreD [Chloroflexota bacterium]
MRTFFTLVIVLGIALVLQTALVSRITLLSGSADLVLVVLAAWALQERVRLAWLWGVAAGFLVGGVSGAPWFIYLAAYLSVIGIARLLTRRIWQAPLLAMFAVTFIGTLVLVMFTYVYRILFEISLPFGEVFVQVILPSVLLNLLLAVAIHPLMHDIAGRLYPAEVTA